MTFAQAAAHGAVLINALAVTDPSLCMTQGRGWLWRGCPTRTLIDCFHCLLNLPVNVVRHV
ncbi:MAG: hypothetical protein OHK0023_01440 [Anaerolineae bacterium]